MIPISSIQVKMFRIYLDVDSVNYYIKKSDCAIITIPQKDTVVRNRGKESEETFPIKEPYPAT